jgi:phosphoenolpyruvate carboxykinase (ATP)
MPLRFTRAVIDGIHSGTLADAPVVRDPIMGLDVISTCPGVPTEMLQPALSWRDTAAYEATARKLAERFRTNFEKYSSAVDPAIVTAGPPAPQ